MSRVLVTGAAGFIGSAATAALAALGLDVVAVDRDDRVTAITGDVDVIGATEFTGRLAGGGPSPLDSIDAVIHLGANADTMSSDVRSYRDDNYRLTAVLLEACAARRLRGVYASSAAVYGAAGSAVDGNPDGRPLNLYGWSKLAADIRARRLIAHGAPLLGLRFFNVYGPNEAHKGRMASMVHQMVERVRRDAPIQLFGASHGVDAGAQRRDFIAVGDVVAVIAWAIEHPEVGGVVDCGTGTALTFNEVAGAVTRQCGRGAVEYIPFPAELRDRYQAHTLADPRALRSVGFDRPFTSIDDGVAALVSTEPGVDTTLIGADQRGLIDTAPIRDDQRGLIDTETASPGPSAPTS
jgi:ADP-L-glycero-D-manno-heptose 6-epimerase